MNRHSLETIRSFIELRARGWSFDRLAAHLKVGRRTLVVWQGKFARRIEAARRLELEAVLARTLPSQENELTRLSGRLDQVEAVLAKRKLDCLSTEFLYCLAGSLRAQIQRQCSRPATVLSDAPV